MDHEYSNEDFENDDDDLSGLNNLKDYQNYLQKQQATLELIKHENAMLNEKYSMVSNKLASQKESAKQQLLQAETVGMMTKYQLVFVKMETAFSKIFNHNKLRDMNRIQEAFTKFKLNAIKNRVALNCNSRIALENIKNFQFLRIFERTQRLNMRDSFSKWRRMVSLNQKIAKKKQELDHELDEKLNSNKRIERRITEIEEEIEENDKRYNHLSSIVKDNKKKISMYESKGKELSSDINLMMEKVPKIRGDIGSKAKPSPDRLSVLQSKLAQALEVKKNFEGQLDMTQLNVKSFITEMSSLITSKEISQMLGASDPNDLFEEESGGGSRYYDDQRAGYHKSTRK